MSTITKFEKRDCGLQFSLLADREKSSRNLIESTRCQIVFTIFRMIRNHTDFRLVPIQSEPGKYNLICNYKI